VARKIVSFCVKVEVHDEEALRAYATERWLATGGDPDEDFASLGAAALEALVLGNEGPAPLDIGVEILGHDTETWEER
jgi:hypothetical protein